MSRQFTLLGKLNIEENGRIAKVMKSPKTCGLLAYLIVTNQAHRREEIADLFWDSETTAQSLTRLRVLLGRTKKSAPELMVTRQTIAFEGGEETAVDYQTVIEGFQSTEPSIIEKALQQYNGELLSGFYLPDAPRFNEWLLMERERLRYDVQTAYHKLCVAYEDNEAWERGAAAAQRWLALNELDEAALRWLMQFLAASGQVTVALKQYEHNRQRLWDELEVTPEPATVELAQKLARLQEERGEGISWDRIVGVQLERPLPHQLAEPGLLPKNSVLPYLRNQDFVGRRKHLLDLAALLLPQPSESESFTRTVAVTGMGGLGKTQLAVEFCYRYGRYFPGGVFWLSFADAENVTVEVVALGSEKGLGLYKKTAQLTLDDKVGRVQKAWQEPIPRLLIFDNCEDEALLAKWCPKTGGGRVLLTSRRGSWSPELGVIVQPLSILSHTSGMALLQQLVPDLSETDANAIASEVGHLPLALHLAGGFLRRYRMITPEKYLNQVRRQGLLAHPSMHGRGTEYSPTEHELSVARTFTINFEQLDTTDEIDSTSRQMLVQAACFAPGEPIPSQLLLTTMVSDEEDIDRILVVEDAFARLVALGFLANEGGKTVVMHRLIAAFLAETVNDAAQIRVAQIIYQVVDNQRRQKSSLFVLPISLGHIRHVHQIMLVQKNILAAHLGSLIGLHLIFVADYDGARTFLEQALSLYAQTNNHFQDRLVCLNNLGILHLRLGAYHEAQLAFKQVLTLRTQFAGNKGPQKNDTQNNIGYVLSLQGDYKAAKKILANLLKRESEMSEALMATVANNLGVALTHLGEYEQAAALLDRSLTVRQRILGDAHPFVAVSLQSLGDMFRQQQAYDQAQAYLEKALTIRKNALGHHPHTARSLNALGVLFLAQNDYGSAQSYFEQALAIQDVVLPSNHPAKGWTLKGLGDLHWAMGNQAQARPFYAQALGILETAVIPSHPELQSVRSLLNA